ncbi:glycosyltransferase [Methanohalophilus euhalobius]|uniref:Glycosyltransferase involved in cell wall biosynthesis n=1 Tax=Methanohalophilus euhalobius TaxID=51203 RepID=A0A315A156_9EURY|nr:glycosyltransferase [Methanohalophilus euhalobius]PQV43138.1 glycosyltransferase involved in cell wall biosynthesis [Methanohalophilus euhalobius]
MREWGYESNIYAQNVHPEVNAKKYSEYKKISSQDNILIFHFSIGSDISDFIKELPDKKILFYHNMTPFEYFYGINETLVHLLRNGRNELRSLVNYIDLAIGDSEYNRLELQEMGFKKTDVMSLLLDFEKYKKPNEQLLKRYEDEYVNILFVGRIVPNKKQEDLIKIYYYYKSINPKSRLFLIGGYEGCETYYYFLQDLIRNLNLKGVHLLGKIDFHDLIAYYHLADVFLCMSEHEGFCVPLLESMNFGVPIIAYNSTAIPYTLGNTGILVNKKRYDEIAEMVHILIEDKKLKNSIIKKQKERLNDFEKEKIIHKFYDILHRMMK